MGLLLGKLKSWAAWIGAAVVMVAAAFLYGRADGRRDAEAARLKKNAKAAKKARGVEDEINKMDGGAVDGRLRGWMRDGR